MILFLTEKDKPSSSFVFFVKTTVASLGFYVTGLFFVMYSQAHFNITELLPNLIIQRSKYGNLVLFCMNDWYGSSKEEAGNSTSSITDTQIPSFLSTDLSLNRTVDVTVKLAKI